MQPFLFLLSQVECTYRMGVLPIPFLTVLRVRKCTTIVLFLSFFALQYARQISYLQCRYANYSRPTGSKCDCGQILIAGTQPGSFDLFPPDHQHLHLDEWFSTFLCQEFYDRTMAVHTTWYVANKTAITTGIRTNPDHPPRRC